MTPSTQERLRAKRKTTYDQPFEKAHKALLSLKKDACWKDVIPFLIKWIDENQPDDTNYCLDFWMKTRRRK